MHFYVTSSALKKKKKFTGLQNVASANDDVNGLLQELVTPVIASVKSADR